MTHVNQLLAKKQALLKQRMAHTSIDGLRAMASMQSRPIPFLTTVGAPTAIVGQVRYQLPRTGDLSTRYDPVMIAKTYVEGGADAIAMFTDAVPEYDGTVDMTLVNEAMRFQNVPVINQDYMIHEYNLVAARAAGASVVVLTSGLLPSEKLRLLTSVVHRNRMTAIVDVFDATQLKHALAWSPQVIGLSGTDPTGYSVDLDHVAQLRPLIPVHQSVMITQALHQIDELRRVAEIGVDAVTVSDRLLLGYSKAQLLQALRRT